MIKQYALLRNNKQIGLYTLKEILRIELFTTDLVWIQAKSIAWVSPDKIEELKQYVKPAAQALKTEPAPVERPEAAISQKEAPLKVEVIEEKAKQNNDEHFFPSKLKDEQPEPLVSETEFGSKAEIKDSVQQDGYKDFTAARVQDEQRKLVVNEMEFASNDLETNVLQDDNTGITRLTNQNAQPNVLGSKTESILKREGNVQKHDNNTNSSPVVIQSVQQVPVFEETSFSKDIKIEADVLRKENTDNSSEATQGLQQEPVANERETVSKREVVVQQDNSFSSSNVTIQSVQQVPVFEETSFALNTRIETNLQHNTNTDISLLATQGEHVKHVVNESEITSNAEREEGVPEDDGREVRQVAIQDEQPERATNERENTLEAEMEESKHYDDDKDAYAAAIQGEKLKPVVNEKEIASNAEIEDVVHQDEKDLSTEAIRNEQPNLIVNETESISKSGANNENYSNFFNIIIQDEQPEAAVNETEIAYQVDKNKSSVATQDEQLKPVVIEPEIASEAHNSPGSESFAAACVILPPPTKRSIVVAQKSKENEANDAIKTSVTPYVIKPERLPETEGPVYVRFPIGAPQSLFYKNKKSVEDKLEIKAFDGLDTKIYATKPKPRKLE